MEETGQAQHLFVSGIVYEDRYYVCRSVYFEKETGKSRFTEKFSFIQDGGVTKQSRHFVFTVRCFVCL